MKHILTFLILALSVTIYGQKEINANLTVEGQLKVNTVSELTLRPVETTKMAVFDTGNVVHYITIEEILDLATPQTAAETSITDTGAYYTGTDVEAALQEIGAEFENKMDKEGIADYFATVTGTFDIDLERFSSRYIILSGNTTITASNTPASGKSVTRTLHVKGNGSATLTLPSGWEVYGTFDTSGGLNKITLEFSNYPTVGLVVDCFINQPD